MKVKRIVTGVFGVNTYVISNGDEAIIIDPGMSLDLDLIKEYNIVAVLITHGHIDHIDGIKLFKDKPIYISSLDEPKLYDRDLSLYRMLNMNTPFKVGTLKINEVNDGDIINLIDLEFKVIGTPGHTNGSVCYLVNNILFSGDTLFRMGIGRTDFPTGSMLDINKSLTRLTKLPNEVKVYPGHDDMTSIKEEKINNPYLFKKS